MEDEIKEIILDYCEGIEYLEFNKSDLPEMVEKINKLSSQRIKELEDRRQFDFNPLGD